MTARYSKSVETHIYLESPPDSRKRYFVRVDPFDSQEGLKPWRYWAKDNSQESLEECREKAKQFKIARAEIGGSSTARRAQKSDVKTPGLRGWGGTR